MSHIYVIVIAACMSIANSLLLKHLATEGAPTPSTLVIRGGVCLLLSIFAASQNKAPLLPVKAKKQAIRLVLSALAIGCGIYAYNGMHASSVALLTRLDIPAAILVGAIVGMPVSRSKLTLATSAIVYSIFFAIFIRSPEESIASYMLAGASAMILAISHIYVRGTATEEAPHVLPAIPAMGLVAFGLISHVRDSSPLIVSASQVAGASCSGLLMYFLYFIMRSNYRVLKIGEAEFFQLAAALALLCIEMTIFKQQHSLSYVFAFLGLGSLTTFALFMDRKNYGNQIEAKA